MGNQVTFIGADRDDQGPKGLVLRYLEAAIAKDENAFNACLAENSREMIGVDQIALEGCTVTIGDVAAEGELFFVSTTATDEKGTDSFAYAVREENGELRVDMQATMERMMGMTQEEARDQIIEKVADELETVAEEVAGAIPKNPESMIEAAVKGDDEEAGLHHGIWMLSEEAMADFPEQILTAGYAVGRFMTPMFSPPMQELDTEEYGTDESQVKTTRYGDGDHGFSVTENLTSGEGFSTHSVSVSSYGDPQGRQISAEWVKTQYGDTPPNENVTITAMDSEESLKAVGKFISEEIGVKMETIRPLG